MEQRTAHSAQVELRPSWGKYARSAFRLIPLGIAYLAVQFWLGGQGQAKDSPWELLLVGVIVMALAGDITYQMSRVVRLGPSQLEISRPLFPPRVIRRSLIHGLAFRGVVSYLGPTRLYTVVYDDRHRAIVTLPQAIFDEAALLRLQRALGFHDTTIRYVNTGELQAEFPGALRPARYLGWFLAILVMGMIFVGVAITNR